MKSMSIKTVDGEALSFEGIADGLAEEATANCSAGLGFRFEGDDGSVYSYAPGSLLWVRTTEDE